MIYTMKDVSRITGLSYDTLKFYCNEGLIPSVKRDSRNHRIFDDKDLNWIAGILCLRQCEMPLKEMKTFLALCLEGETTLGQRIAMLDHLEDGMVQKQKRLEEDIAYIQKKKNYYHQIQNGEKPYFSTILPDGKSLEESKEAYFRQQSAMDACDPETD